MSGLSYAGILVINYHIKPRNSPQGRRHQIYWYRRHRRTLQCRPKHRHLFTASLFPDTCHLA